MILSPVKAGKTEFGLQPFPPISFRFNSGRIVACGMGGGRGYAVRVNWPPDKYWFFGAVLMYGLSTVYSVFLWRKGFRQDDRLNYVVLLLAFGFHTVAMVQRGFSFNRCPVNNLYEAIAFVGWTMVTSYLVLGLWPRLRFLGVFAAPVLFALSAMALFPEFDVRGQEAAFGKGWLSSHAAVVLLAYGSFGLAAVAGLMYLSQEHDLKFRKLRAVVALMPPIERLERVIGGSMVTGLILLSLGLLLGVINLRQLEVDYSFWDTKVIWSALIWALYLGLLLARRWYARGGRRFAWGAVGSFAFVLLTFWGTNLLSSIHQS
jgi:ABC-type uncharacterized transport system permease subunit